MTPADRVDFDAVVRHRSRPSLHPDRRGASRGAPSNLLSPCSWHEMAKVRQWALHALACDRCKQGECRPGEDDVVPIVERMLATDRSRHVRQAAACLLGEAVARRPDVVAALERARDTDPHPKVRMVAGWYTPGHRPYERVVRAHELAQRREARDGHR